jgi:hypothetical protein
MRALLLGESGSLIHLKRFLERRGFECSLATSVEGSLAAFGPKAFHLILSTLLPYDDPLLADLATSSCDIFACFPVKDSCWWLPIMRSGHKCFGVAALRPKEIARTLEDTAGTRGSKTRRDGPLSPVLLAQMRY